MTILNARLVAVFGVFVLSVDTVLIREVGVFQDMAVAFYRYFLLAVAIAVFLLFTEGNKFIQSIQKVGRYGVIAGVLLGTSNICFTYGIQNASVSSVLVLVSTGSVFSSVFARIFLKEIIPARTVVAITVCLGCVIGIFTMQFESQSTAEHDGNGGNDPLGLLGGLGSAILIGAYFVAVKYASIEVHKDIGHDEYISMIPCNLISGLWASILSLALGAAPQSVHFFGNHAEAGAYLIIQGLVVQSVAFAALTYAAESCPSAEVNLAMLLETMLGPLLVWLAGYEAPPAETLYFGSLIILVLFIHGILSRQAEVQEKQDKENNNERSERLETQTSLVMIEQQRTDGYNTWTCDKTEPISITTGTEADQAESQVDQVDVELPAGGIVSVEDKVYYSALELRDITGDAVSSP